ncbi:hypothetical protein CLOM_g19927 [Closterium sp. NIES-68]|nr:hypothetical protein CLOM_g19927 [Closterium sp. NIES-68]GJP70676.1 hypothetical protein CLOP_g1583 [Closterium sp. NIES-67]
MSPHGHRCRTSVARLLLSHIAPPRPTIPPSAQLSRSAQLGQAPHATLSRPAAGNAAASPRSLLAAASPRPIAAWSAHPSSSSPDSSGPSMWQETCSDWLRIPAISKVASPPSDPCALLRAHPVFPPFSLPSARLVLSPEGAAWKGIPAFASVFDRSSATAVERAEGLLSAASAVSTARRAFATAVSRTDGRLSAVSAVSVDSAARRAFAAAVESPGGAVGERGKRLSGGTGGESGLTLPGKAGNEGGRKGGEDETRVVVYRGRWMRLLRLMVRLKVAQLVGVASLAVPIAAWTQGASLSLGTSLAVGAVVGGAGAASACLWFYSSRYVGEMALVRKAAGGHAAAGGGGGDAGGGGGGGVDGEQWHVCISTLDFWGNRENLTLPLSAIAPPLKGLSQHHLRAIAQQSFVPLDVPSHRQFVLSIRHGRIPNLPLLLGVLKGDDDWEKDMQS